MGWFYYDKNGKIGPLTDEELKASVACGTIKAGTIIETEDGRHTLAKNIRGLFPMLSDKKVEPPVQKFEPPVPKETSASPPNSTPVEGRRTEEFYYLNSQGVRLIASRGRLEELIREGVIHESTIISDGKIQALAQNVTFLQPVFAERDELQRRRVSNSSKLSMPVFAERDERLNLREETEFEENLPPVAASQPPSMSGQRVIDSKEEEEEQDACWFFLSNNIWHGPLPEKEIYTLIKKGRIHENTMIQKHYVPWERTGSYTKDTFPDFWELTPPQFRLHPDDIRSLSTAIALKIFLFSIAIVPLLFIAQILLLFLGF